MAKYREGMAKYLGKITALARKDQEDSRKASGRHGKVSGGHGKAFLKDHSIGKEGSGRQLGSIRRAWQKIGNTSGKY